MGRIQHHFQTELHGTTTTADKNAGTQAPKGKKGEKSDSAGLPI
jgi:hypothetical protein